MTATTPPVATVLAPSVLEETVLEPLSEPFSSAEPIVIKANPDVRALPLFGGTLLVTRSGQWAVAAHPDQGLVSVVDLAQRQLTQQFNLGVTSTPVRLAEDGDGMVHVVARGLGAVVSFDPALPEVTLTRAVCNEPRGIAFDAFSDELVVACQGGELVWLGAGIEPVRLRRLAADLRDVAVLEDHLVVSTWRHAQLLEVSREGELLNVRKPPTVSDDEGNGVFEPHVAGRLAVTSNSDVLLLHQRSSVGRIGFSYQVASACGGVSHNALSMSKGGKEAPRGMGVLPPGVMLDFAVAADGIAFAALATAAQGQTALYQGLLDSMPSSPCADVEPSILYVAGTATALAFDAEGRLLLQRQNEVNNSEDLEILGEGLVTLIADVGQTPGRDLFYETTPQGVACASCHPEGGEDGTTWHFSSTGLRRTQPIAGRLSGTAPLHWQGEFGDLRALLQDTLVGRMGGTLPTDDRIVLLGEFIDQLVVPAPLGVASDLDAVGSATVETPAIAGAQLFTRLQCNGCHSGVSLTDNLNHDVGTGGEFQTPSLRGVAYRLPAMHDGCADTLLARFGTCGGDERHGAWQDLTSNELNQLVAYLESL